MNFEYVFQISVGVAMIYLFFISWNFNVRGLLTFFVFKAIPFVLACIFLFKAIIECGYIVKV